MNEESTDLDRSSAWQTLRRWTPARVALGRTGGSLPTAALLEFRLAHAQARDALLRPLDEERLVQGLEAETGGPVLQLHSAAANFEEFLLRPDRGRRLSPDSIECLKTFADPPPDPVLIVSEGLSTLAVETHAVAVLHELLPLFRVQDWRLSPICLVRRGRVAIQDHIGELLGARLALILLGERPGLISPDSLGAYLVYRPRCGNTDAQRNCVSNINGHGLSAAQAAAKIHWLLTEARRRQTSGVELKDEFDPALRIGKLSG